MRLLAALPVLLAGCLDAPPGAIADGDGGGASADGDVGAPDAPPRLCASSLTLDLRDEEDLTGWAQDNDTECSQRATPEGREFTNLGSPAFCKAYADGAVKLVNGQRLRIRLVDHDPDLSMSFSVVLGPPEIPVSDRRWLYFERDNSLLMFGECNTTTIGGCSDVAWGSVAYQALNHVWLSFRFDQGAGTIVLETSSDGSTFNMSAEPTDVSDDDAACVTIDIGSYESDSAGVPRRSSFADLIFE